MRPLAVLLLLPLLGATAASDNTPSFACTGALSASERAICSDPELSALDRAISLIYPGARSNRTITLPQQKQWLAQRDKCGADKGCLRTALIDWPGYPGSTYGAAYARPDRRDTGTLQMGPIGGGWYAFSAMAVHIVLDQRGRFLTANDGEADGVVFISGAKGHYSSDPGGEFACEIDFERAGTHWQLSDNGECGGLNVTLSGSYFPTKPKKAR